MKQILIDFLTKGQDFRIIVRALQIRDALRDLVPFIQFKKREKHPGRSVNFSKVIGFSPQLY